MRKIHVDYNRLDIEGHLIVGLPKDTEPYQLGEHVETWQSGEPDMVFTGVIDEITETGKYKITVNWS